jgi:hypothetical protein
MAVALAEAGEFRSAIASLSQAREIDKSDEGDDPIRLRDWRDWMETILKRFRNNRAYRELPPDSALERVRFHQPPASRTLTAPPTGAIL